MFPNTKKNWQLFILKGLELLARLYVTNRVWYSVGVSCCLNAYGSEYGSNFKSVCKVAWHSEDPVYMQKGRLNISTVSAHRYYSQANASFSYLRRRLRFMAKESKMNRLSIQPRDYYRVDEKDPSLIHKVSRNVHISQWASLLRKSCKEFTDN